MGVVRHGVRFCLIACGFLAALSSPGANADDVLFFGNSFTFGASVPGLSAHGGVPKMVEEIARTKAHAMTAASLSAPGVDFGYHLTQPATAAALASKTWTWVVLQDYSTQPTRMGNVSKFMRDGVTFSNRIAQHSPHAGIILYETWARPPGYFYKTLGGRQFTGPADMMADLHSSYAALGNKLAALNPDRPVRVALVGTAFARCHAEFPDIVLDATDHHHATQEGYYLAAMVIFEAIYHQSAMDAPVLFFNGVVSIPPADATRLQQVADEVSGAWQPGSTVRSAAKAQP
jgi:hypothetical protein